MALIMYAPVWDKEKNDLQRPDIVWRATSLGLTAIVDYSDPSW